MVKMVPGFLQAKKKIVSALCPLECSMFGRNSGVRRGSPPPFGGGSDPFLCCPPNPGSTTQNIQPGRFSKTVVLSEAKCEEATRAPSYGRSVRQHCVLPANAIPYALYTDDMCLFFPGIERSLDSPEDFLEHFQLRISHCDHYSRSCSLMLSHFPLTFPH